MYATATATANYAARHPGLYETGFYRTIFDLKVSTLGTGTYLDASVDALLAAAEGGINFFDTAINYRNQQSERDLGAALERLQRDEVVVCTKAGYLTPGAVPPFLKPADVVGGSHSMTPEFLEDQIERSRGNLGIDTIDVFYLHNPETQLGFVSRGEFDDRVRRAFARLERLADAGRIRWYGAATWNGFRKPDLLSLRRLSEIALEEGGADHRFRFIQLPFNLGMVEAYADGPISVLQQAAELGVAVIASATLMQTQVLDHMPDAVAELLPGLETAAQRAIQFTRSTPGIAVALVGMGRREHVVENLGVARVPPATPEQYQRLYR
jgi:aryl-alcohol dehydrogenase-like predicted oxidoreductase